MRLPFWGSILTAIGVFVLCSLGFWQLDRLVWKTNLLDRLAAERAIDAKEIPLDPNSFKVDDILTRGFLAGRYLHDAAVMVAPRTLNGAAGFHLITPFALDDVHGGGVILVNRGWLPVSYERPDDYAVYSPEGQGVLIGALRPVPGHNFFTPENVPDQDLWYRISPEDIQDVSGVDILDQAMFYVETERFAAPSGAYPIAVTRDNEISNNHAQYALFWFSMAVLMVGVFCLRFVFVRSDASNS